jgi:hypothetical protein
MQFLQEFSIRQGVGGSHLGFGLGLLGNFGESGAGAGPDWGGGKWGEGGRFWEGGLSVFVGVSGNPL